MRLEQNGSVVTDGNCDILSPTCAEGINCLNHVDCTRGKVDCIDDISDMSSLNGHNGLTSCISRDREVTWPSYSKNRSSTYRFASVSCPEKKCSKIGVQMLAEGGSAIDAMIAAFLALAVERSLSSGIGGGGFMTYYNRSSEETFVLDFRETAPKSAYSTMYEDSDITTKIGGGSIAVPGEVAGMWEAHQKFGRLSWSRLFEPAIELAENGIMLNEYIMTQLKEYYHEFNDTLRTVFTDSETGQMKKVGDRVVFSKLAQTYRRIAEGGPETFYKGDLRDDIMADLEEFDGQIVTAEDFENYKTEIRTPLRSRLNNGGYSVVSPPPPSGGLVLHGILNILDGYGFTKESISPKMEKVSSTATTYHRILEASKFSYATRMDLGDPNYIDISELVENMTDSDYTAEIRKKITDDTTHDPDYYGATTDGRKTTGTSHISILAGNGDAVSATSSINGCWGAKRMGRRTGIIFNNLMDDFSMPGTPSWTNDAWIAPSSEANWIEPGKRPLSAMCPTIVTDTDGDVVLVTGGSGGAQITTATAITIINYLWLEQSLLNAVSRPRLHHQLLPNSTFYEKGFPEEYLEELRKKNHTFLPITYPPVSDSIGSRNGVVNGVGDYRRLGNPDGF